MFLFGVLEYSVRKSAWFVQLSTAKRANYERGSLLLHTALFPSLELLAGGFVLILSRRLVPMVIVSFVTSHIFQASPGKTKEVQLYYVQRHSWLRAMQERMHCQFPLPPRGVLPWKTHEGTPWILKRSNRFSYILKGWFSIVSKPISADKCLYDLTWIL